MWNKSAEGKASSSASDATGQAAANQKANPVPSQPNASPVPASTEQPKYAAPAAPPSASSTISAGLKVSGEFSGNSDLYIDGEALGKIRLASSRVTIGPNGRVQADIEAREIVIEGSVNGNLKAGERLQLGAQSRMQGSVVTPRIAIEDGARLSAKVEMLRAGDSRSAASTAGGSAATAESGGAKVMSASGKEE
jgi:cytoskeletal protein CcmA (bactofilin family)